MAAAAAAGGAGLLGQLALHEEPANALSVLTWATHVGSVSAWAKAMSLAWRYGELTGEEGWKGLAVSMTPLLGAGCTACVFHFFYNPPELEALSSLQGAFTLAGNSAMCVQAYRLFSSPATGQGVDGAVLLGGAPAPAEGRGARKDGRAAQQKYVLDLAISSVAISVLVKYGSLALDLPFEPSLGAALAIIAGTTAAGIAYAAAEVAAAFAREG